MDAPERRQPTPRLKFEDVIPDEQWRLYRPLLETLQARQIRFAVGGGLAVCLYAGHARNTKDLDLFILPQDSEATVDAMSDTGFNDLYDRQPYRRDWIYRGTHGDLIIDAIWQMANGVAQVDFGWIDPERTVDLDVQSVRLPLVPPEELIWAKSYVMHRDRCDWPDALNMLHGQVHAIDFDRLLDRAGEDRTFLAGLFCVFRWLCPDVARHIPEDLWQRLGLQGLPDEPEGRGGQARARLLDSYHDWFGPLNPDEIQPRRDG